MLNDVFERFGSNCIARFDVPISQRFKKIFHILYRNLFSDCVSSDLLLFFFSFLFLEKLAYDNFEIKCSYVFLFYVIVMVCSCALLGN